MIVGETLKEFDVPLLGKDRHAYRARACGGRRPDGLWEGWVELDSIDGSDISLTTGRETTQPNKISLLYWATGLSRVFLEGALVRATERVDDDVVADVAEEEEEELAADAYGDAVAEDAIEEDDEEPCTLVSPYAARANL